MTTKRALIRAAVGCTLLVLFATAAIRAQQPAQQPAPTGPLAPEKYKDIQVLKDVPADQLDLTMRYFVAATGLQCQTCHVRDQATGEFAYDKDTRAKTTARNMIRLVQTVNAGDFGARINCGTCHAGRNQPAGLQPAQMMTADQIAAAAAAEAARQGGPGGAQPGRGTPPAGAAPGQPGAGRGNQPAGPPVDDVLGKYLEALGGRAGLEAIQSRVMSGTLVTRAGQSMNFTIEEKGVKYRETTQQAAGPVTIAFDGERGWIQNGTTVSDLDGFPLQQAVRLSDLVRPLRIKEQYQNLQPGRPARLPAATPGGAPTDVNLIQGSSAPNVTERLYFDATSGLLVRRQVITRTPLNGSLTETIDYSDYRPVAGGVKMPFSIRRNSWATLDTFTIVDVKPNAPVDDAKFAKPGK
ncbi:MAG: photosynthetic reaction center cytochrome c subunit family protein [Acidobacteriota bacterium]